MISVLTIVLVSIIKIKIIKQHFFVRHISDHCGHSEAHYSMNDLHIN